MSDRAASLAPAWPTLLGVQIVAIALLAGTAWRFVPHRFGAPDDLDRRLLALDVDASIASLDVAIDRARHAGALLPEAEGQERSFLSLLARGTDLDPGPIVLSAEPSGDGPVGVRASLQLSGDAYALPAFIDGLHRQHATAVLESVDAELAPGGAAQATIAVRFFRPAELQTDWVADRLALRHPGAGKAAPVLERAAELAAWRQVAAADVEQRTVAAGLRVRIAKELPAALVRLRRTGGAVRWTPTDGLVTRAR